MPIVGLLIIELYLPNATSLKDKRSVLRSVRDRLKKLNVSAAEIEYQDLWQRAKFGAVVISNSNDIVNQTLQTAIEEINRIDPELIIKTQIDFIL